MKRIVLSVAAVVITGCGAGVGSAEDVAASWVRAVDAEQWEAACAATVKPSGDCERSLKENFAGKRVRLLPAGEFQSGDEFTDNKTKFAMETDRDDIGYFKIVRVKGEQRIDLQVTVLAYHESS